ncbi:MAG: glutamate mutase L [Candidatus Aegiribacteria sp.]|nr:glutamate mutase L [Candidatus Aegiribacteria sp.]
MESNQKSEDFTSGERKTGMLIITDVGSTTTKALLLQRSADNTLHFIDSADVPTTVEEPFEDVCIGVVRAIRKLESQTGEYLSRGKGMPSVPYLSTSSAGGGLQMIVFGLTSVETGKIAENTASNAGGVILKMFSIDDGLQAVEKMLAIQNLHPDMIMLAGGTDGGAVAGVVRLAELLVLSKPQPKFRSTMKVPLIFCGNTFAREFISDVLEDSFDIHIVDNVRPSLTELNTEPARNEVHRLFMENVMERAPGYSELKNYVVSDILPTPVGVENILRLYSSHVETSVLMMDMGGATTDIFSCITGEYSRTVAANTGMSYSIANVLYKAGIAKLMKYLPDGFDKDRVRDYIYNKTIFPTYIPGNESEVLVEQAAAICGTESSWKEHLDSCYKTTRIGFLDRLKSRNRKMFEETFLTSEEEPFNLSDIEIIIGSGGIISHSDKYRAFWILTEGFRPSGITRLAVDRNFRSPHLGVLSEIDSKAALDLFLEECLEDIGWTVSPFGKTDEGDNVLKVLDRNTGKSWKLSGGDLLFLNSGGNLEFILEDDVSLGNGCNHLNTELPVLIDCRGHGDNAIEKPLASSDIPEFTHNTDEFTHAIRPEHGELITGEWEIDYRLPYKGDLFVKTGDNVEHGTVLGVNRFDPPRLYMIDLNKIPGYDRHLSAEEIRSGLLIKEGDKVKLNAPLYKVHRKGLQGFDFTFHSTVRGRVTKIEKTGLIILREIQDYDEKPHVIDIAGPLDIKPKHIRGYMKVGLDRFVEAGQVIASDMSNGKAVTVKSPTSGILKAIDITAGKVTVQFDINPVRMFCHVSGTVSEILPDHLVRVSGNGTRLNGVIGFGGENSGILTKIDSGRDDQFKKDCIAFSTAPVDLEFLKLASEAGVSGIIAPSIPASDWVRYNGEELGVAITGDEDIPFTLILTSGFGSFVMNEECAEFLNNSIGKYVGVSGRTQIRAGVTRPMVII